MKRAVEGWFNGGGDSVFSTPDRVGGDAQGDSGLWLGKIVGVGNGLYVEGGPSEEVGRDGYKLSKSAHCGQLLLMKTRYNMTAVGKKILINAPVVTCEEIWVNAHRWRSIEHSVHQRSMITLSGVKVTGDECLTMARGQILHERRSRENNEKDGTTALNKFSL